MESHNQSMLQNIAARGSHLFHRMVAWNKDFFIALRQSPAFTKPIASLAELAFKMFAGFSSFSHGLSVAWRGHYGY